MFIQATEVQIDAPLRQRDLHDVVVQLRKIELRVIRQIDRVGTDAYLGARFRVGRKPGAGCNRQIDPGCRPIGVARTVKSEVAGDKAHPSDTSGRFHLRQGGNSEEEDQKKEAFYE